MSDLQSFITDRLPEAWETRPFWSMFQRVKVTGMPDEELLSVYRDHGVIPKSSRDDNHNKESEDLSGYQLVEPGYLVTNKMKAWQGSIAISRYRGIVSPAYYAYRPTGTMDDQFVHYLLRSAPYIALYGRISKGVRVNQWDLEHAALRKVPLILPELRTQRAIARFLDRETARIDALISAKLRQIELASEEIESMVAEAIAHENSFDLRFQFAAKRAIRPVDISEHTELVRLGLYNRGRGIFKKPAADEEGMGDSDFFAVKPGDLILSGQFAWEGAVAMADETHAGCVVSHRYPVYRGCRGVRTSYLLALLRSRYGDFILNEASRGSAGRNKPLNAWRLGREKIAVPPDAMQARIEHALNVENRLRQLNQRSIHVLQERRTAVITAAVTGQFQLSQLNTAEEEMAA